VERESVAGTTCGTSDHPVKEHACSSVFNRVTHTIELREMRFFMRELDRRKEARDVLNFDEEHG
jgi:hypothetical protein